MRTLCALTERGSPTLCGGLSGGRDIECLQVCNCRRFRKIEAETGNAILNEGRTSVRNPLERLEATRDHLNVGQSGFTIVQEAPVEGRGGRTPAFPIRRVDRCEMPDVGHLVGPGRIDPYRPPAHLVGQHEGRGVAGEDEAVECGCIPSFTEQGLRADEHADLTLREQGGGQPHQFGRAACPAFDPHIIGAARQIGGSEGGRIEVYFRRHSA